MTDLNANVVIDLDGNLPQASRRFGRHIDQFATKGSKRLAMMKRSTAALSNQFDRMGNRAALGAAGLTYLFKRTFIDTAAQFEDFQAVLETVEGSNEKAQKSMGWVSEFAATTPFELAQVTDAFVKLKAFGMDPINNDLLRTLGDTAAGMKKPINQAVEAIADAVTGENERLKEFGIKARVSGKRVVYEYTLNGETMRKAARKNSREQIQATLQAIWNEKYAGSMDKMSRNWGGLTSNLSDQWTLFQQQVMANGTLDFLKGEVSGLLEEIERLRESGELDDKAKVFSDELIEGLKAAKEAGSALWEVMKGIGSAVKFISQYTGGYAGLGKFLATAYLANKAFRFAGSVKNGISSVRGSKSSGNPLLDAAGKMMPVPVYVVNGPGGLGKAMGKAGGLIGGGGKVHKSAWQLLKNQDLKTIKALGAPAIARATGFVGLAGAGGYAIGKYGVNPLLSEQTKETIGGVITQILANFGSEDAQRSLDNHFSSKIQIDLTGPAAEFARVKQVEGDADVAVSGEVMGGH